MSTLLTRALEKRANTWSQMQEIQATAEREGRDLTVEERQAWDRAEADLTAASEDVERMERMARLDTVQRDQLVIADGPTGEDRSNVDPEADYCNAFNAFVRGGMNSLEPVQRQLLASNHQQVRAQATSPGTAGGYLIPTDTLRIMTETMKAYGGILGVSNVITTSTGNPLNWPTNDDTGNVGAILGENTQVTEQDVTLGQKDLGAFTYTSKLVRVSLQLLQDEIFGLETWLPRKLGERIGRAAAAHFATGTGTGQPEGLFTNATTGKTGAAGQVTSVIYDDLIDLIHSVDPAYRDRGRFVMADAALKVVRKLKDTQGRPLWEPSVQAGVPSSLLGYPVTIDQGVPVPAASAKSIGFGDTTAAYVVRQVNGGQMMRLEERYADFLQVGFLGFLRLDATPDDSSAFRVYAHPAA